MIKNIRILKHEETLIKQWYKENDCDISENDLLHLLITIGLKKVKSVDNELIWVN